MTIAIGQAISKSRNVTTVLSMRRAKGMSVGFLQVGDRSIRRRFTVDMHLLKLDFKSMEVRDMRNEVHEVGELTRNVSVTSADLRVRCSTNLP